MYHVAFEVGMTRDCGIHGLLPFDGAASQKTGLLPKSCCYSSELSPSMRSLHRTDRWKPGRPGAQQICTRENNLERGSGQMIFEAYLGMHYKGIRFPDFESAECWGSCIRSKAARNISLVLVRRFHEK